MFNWHLLITDRDTGTELWRTPTKFLVCQKYYGLYKFLNTEEQARNCFISKISGEPF